jgi:hypothetical protein
MAKGIKYDLYNVARQITFEFYRGDLSPDIRRQLNKYDFEEFGKDEDYNGFSGANFEPESQIQELLIAFENNNKLKELCIEFHCIRQSLKTLSLNGNITGILQCAKVTEKAIPPKAIMPMIGKHILFHFRDNNKTEKELAQLLAYIAIRSIIGEKAYVKTNKLLIICRMFGYSSIKAIEGIQVTELYKKYSNRYHIDNTLKALELDWNICIYSNRTRGLFISINNKFSLQKLVEVAEQKKRSNRLKAFNELKCSIISTALNKASIQQDNNQSTAS